MVDWGGMRFNAFRFSVDVGTWPTMATSSSASSDVGGRATLQLLSLSNNVLAQHCQAQLEAAYRRQRMAPRSVGKAFVSRCEALPVWF